MYLDQNVKSNFDIPYLFGRPLDEIDHIIANKDKHVLRLEIPKHDGTMRKILAPNGKLKYIQKSLYWKFFRRYKCSNAAHGFVSKRGIVSNAAQHVGCKSIGKIDIKSFFDTISTNHLKNVLFGNKNICRYCKYYERMLDKKCDPSIYKNKSTKFEYRCEEMKAIYIPHYCQETGYQSLFQRVMDACTYNGFAAQGFPTSPIIANIVMRGFDETMIRFCMEHGITYTRYADDLSFSSKTMDKHELKKLLQTKVYRLLWAYGFNPNRKKTNWKGHAGRMKVCGVVVNQKLSMQRSDLMLFRAKVHHAVVKESETTTKAKVRELKGYASYLMSIDKHQGDRYMAKLTDFEKSKWSKPKD
jgi:RNA-directed DNA polymerase